MTIDLLDPTLYARNAFWPVLAWLRENAPVYWHEEPNREGFWVLTGYDDVLTAYQDSVTFSSRHGMNLGSDPAAVAAVSQRMLIVSDPPDHTHLKRVLISAFGPAEIDALRPLVERVVDDVMTEALAREEIDVVDAVKRIPNHVVCAMLGVPRADWEWLGTVTTEAFEGDSEHARTGAHAEIFFYFSELLDERRRHPGDDFVSRVAGDTRATESGEARPLTDEEIVFNCNGVLAGANETTRYSSAGAVLAFAEWPDEWHALRRGGVEAVSTAVEEVLRWTVPGMHAMRTATRPAVLRGHRVRPGDRVTLWNAAANRDPAVFAEPDRFRIARAPNRHVTFGGGRHMCLGARLARLELSAFLGFLATRVDHVEIAGDPVFNDSNFTWGLRSLPARLVPIGRRSAESVVTTSRSR